MHKVALFLIAALAASAQTHNQLTPEEKKAGWKLLFDGKTFANWEDIASKAPPGDSWTIEDGSIKTRLKPRITEELISKEKYRDFEWMFEWRVAPGANSGVKYRIQGFAFLQDTRLKPNHKRFEETVEYELEKRAGSRRDLKPDEKAQDYVIGFEYQLFDRSKRKDAGPDPKWTSGALYEMAAPTKDAAKPAGQWNQSRIVLRGNKVEHWLNGEKVLDVMLDSAAVKAGIAQRWGEQSPVYRLLANQPEKECPISLQNHGDEAWFRNIKIRRLSER